MSSTVRISACSRAPGADLLGWVDVVPEGEPLPQGAEDMLDRALSDEPVDVDEAVVAAVASDLVATLGWSREQAEDAARRTAEAQARHDSSEDFALRVAEDVQQWLQDTFLDTTWPACPEHHQHPLWLDDNDPPMWTCRATGR